MVSVPTLALAILLGSQAPLLTFTGLLHDVDGRLKPTPKLTAADGKRVRMVGYVAELEAPPKGGFWLCPRPLHGDESGGGTADLPPESVFVIVRSSPGAVFKPPHRPVEVSGLLRLGAKAMPDGTMTHLRLLLDRPAASTPKKAAQPAKRLKP